jgi:integrase
VSFLHPVSVDSPDWRPVDLGLLARLSKVQSLEPSAFLFGGAHPLSSMTVNRLWWRALTKAGVRYRSPEQLRHTMASVLLSRNAPLLYVAKVGGWASAAVLLRVYARWVPQDFEAEIQWPQRDAVAVLR